MFYVPGAKHRGGFLAGTRLGWAPVRSRCGRLHGGVPCPNPTWASGPSAMSARGTHLPSAPPAGHLAFPSRSWSLSGPGSATSSSPSPLLSPLHLLSSSHTSTTWAHREQEGPRRQPFPAGLSHQPGSMTPVIVFSPSEARRLHSREEKTRTLSSTPRSSRTPSCSRPPPFLSCPPARLLFPWLVPIPQA